jgi:hypothetical protein
VSANDLTVRPATGRAASIAFAIGIAGLVALAAGYAVSPKAFFQSYLMGYMYWVYLSLGCMVLVMLQYMTGGRWGVATRRIGEAGIRTLPLMAVLFLPVAFAGIGALYEWSHPEAVSASHVLAHKAPYLNAGAFRLRALAYFILWISFGYALLRLAARQERAPKPETYPGFRVFSAAGGILYFLTMTFAAVDWGMSLDPHWFSPMYGVIHIIGQALAAMALFIAVAALLSRSAPFRSLYGAEILHDLGKLLLAFTLLWAYVCFSQYLIVYSGNLKEEIPYYIRRLHGGWQVLAVALMLFHFALPFAVLLSRGSKRNARVMLVVAVWMLVLRYADLFWQLAPSMRGDTLSVKWTDFAALAGIGGVWLGVFLRALGSRAVVPVNDPHFKEALADGGH